MKESETSVFTKYVFTYKEQVHQCCGTFVEMWKTLNNVQIISK